MTCNPRPIFFGRKLSKCLDQGIATTDQPDGILLSPKRNTHSGFGQILDLLSMQSSAMGGNGNESNGRRSGNDTFSDSRTSPELRRHRIGSDTAALEFQRNHVQRRVLVALADEQIVAPSGASLSETPSFDVPSGRGIGMIHVDQAGRMWRVFQPYGASLLLACFHKTSGIDDPVDVLQRRRHGLSPSMIRLEILAQSL